MDTEEIRRVVKEELEAHERGGRTARILLPFGLWVGTITLASFILTVLVARETLPEFDVDLAATLSLLMAVVLVSVSIVLYGAKPREKK